MVDKRPRPGAPLFQRRAQGNELRRDARGGPPEAQGNDLHQRRQIEHRQGI